MCHEAVVDATRRLRSDAVAMPSPVDCTRFNPQATPMRLAPSFTLFSPSRIDGWKGHDIIWAGLTRMKEHESVQVFQSDWGWGPQY